MCFSPFFRARQRRAGNGQVWPAGDKGWWHGLGAADDGLVSSPPGLGAADDGARHGAAGDGDGSAPEWSVTQDGGAARDGGGDARSRAGGRNCEAVMATTRNIHFYDENLNDESKTVIEHRFL